MVLFELKKEDAVSALYWYYPEGKKEGYGVLTLDKIQHSINITELAADDFSHEVSVGELNSLRNSVNAMRKENGEPELTEEEWPPSTEPEVSTFYTDQVVKKIADAYERGVLLEEGRVVWY